MLPIAVMKTRNCHQDMLIFALKRDFYITGVSPKKWSVSIGSG